jgi:hypothetical protein
MDIPLPQLAPGVTSASQPDTAISFRRHSPRIVRRLAEIGVLREFTGQARHRRFRYDAYVRLFEEEG